MIRPCGIPNTFGWWEGQPVWFEQCGLPCTLADLRAGVAALDRAADELTAAATDYARAAQQVAVTAAERRQWIARLEGMADGHADAA